MLLQDFGILSEFVVKMGVEKAMMSAFRIEPKLFDLECSCDYSAQMKLAGYEIPSVFHSFNKSESHKLFPR